MFVEGRSVTAFVASVNLVGKEGGESFCVFIF